MRVLHIADIHWRGLKRHEEYRRVFSQLFKEARELKPDRIVVAGDIVHTKTQGITPELIQHLVWWFNEMASVCMTIVTLGNHDGLILNKSRLDSISPIIKALDNEKIVFLRDSCVYEDPEFDVAWCNFSCFDEEGWDKVKPAKGLINIALFHGAVGGASTDSDWELEQGEVDMGRFSGFDFGLFGDIHKFQYLDSARRFAYPGSTIQQNYGETLDKGYLIWDIHSKDEWKVTRRLLKNPHPFVTVPWMGTLSETVTKLEEYPTGCRFRIAANSQLMQEEFKELASFLKERMEAAEITWKIEESSQTEVIQLNESSIEKTSLRDHKTHISLLKQFFKEDEFTTEEWKEIETLVENQLAVINENESPRNSKWSLKKMSWENTYTYGKDNVIDFTKLNGVVGLFGPNRSGKSSIPGTLMYGLYNTTDRGPIKNLHIVNVRKGHASVTIDFSVNGRSYRAERMTNKSTNKKGITGAATHMNVYSLDSNGNVIEDLSGEQRRDSDKILRGLIGTPEDFLLTSFASQGEMNSFIRERASARKIFLSSFLDLGVFEDIFVKLKEESYNLKSTIRGPKVDYESGILRATEELASLKSKKEELNAELDGFRSSLTELSVLLATHKTAGIVTQADVDEKQSQVNSVTRKISETNASLEELDTKKSELETKIKKISLLKKDFPIESLREDLSLLNTLETSEARINGKIQSEGIVYRNQEKSISKLDEVPCGDTFPTCKFIQDSHRDKKLIEGQRQIIESLKGELRVISDQLEDLRSKSLSQKITRYEEILRSESLMTEKIVSIEKEKSHLKNVLVTNSSKLNDLENELASLRSRVIDTDEATELSSLKSRISTVSASIKQHETEIARIENVSGRTHGNIESMRSEQENYLKARKDWKKYERLLAAYGKNGIALMILANELPKINSEIAKILQGVTGFTVILEADPDSNDLEILLDYGDSRRPIELGSGMEKMMSSLAIRVALINVSCLPKTDILIIDEGFGALDDTNVEACNRLLSSLKRYFKSILVISHVDEVKEAVDTMIEISVHNKDSHVQFV